MDIGRSFTYMFEDQDWLKKILIGGVLLFIPIVNFVVIGYFIEALRNTAEGRELPLPEWGDFGGKFMKGLMVVIASFLYALPIIIVIGIVVGLTVIADSSDSDAVTTVATTVCPLMGSCLSFMYSILLALILPAATIRYALTEQFGAFFRFGDIMALIKTNVGGYIIALLVAIVANVIAGMVGGIACGIGVLFTTMWFVLVSANLFGNLVREAQPATY